MALTPLEVDNAKYGEVNPDTGKSRNKRADGGNLYLLIKPSGAKYWIYAYRFDGKLKDMSLGPASGPKKISPKEARAKRDIEKARLAEGKNPSGERKLRKALKAIDAGNSFEAVAHEWFSLKSANLSPATINKKQSFLRADILPALGARSLADIETPEILMLLRKIEGRGAYDVAKRCKAIITRIFDYAMQTGRIKANPAASLTDVLTPKQVKNRPAIIKPELLAKLLRDFDTYGGAPATVAALKLSALFLLRPGELRQAQWSEFDFDAALWTVPKVRMKKRRGYEPEDHLVPLCSQAIAILRELQAITGKRRYVFVCASRDMPLSENTINQSLARLGYKGEQTAHGFRATARTIADEVLGVRPECLEAQLAHVVKDFNGRAYQRMAFMEQRKAMMQQWADYLERLKTGAAVIEFGEKRKQKQ